NLIASVARRTALVNLQRVVVPENSNPIPNREPLDLTILLGWEHPSLWQSVSGGRIQAGSTDKSYVWRPDQQQVQGQQQILGARGTVLDKLMGRFIQNRRR